MIFFETQLEFREWLAANYETATELVVGYYKKGTGKPSMTWSESVDQALCFGWIDGVRRGVDDESYTVRFTPRKAKSIWSAVNIAKVEELTAKGLMTPAGVAAFEKRGDGNMVGYRSKDFEIPLSDEFQAIFAKYPRAWEFYESQPPGYRRISSYWVMNAKQEATRRSRLEKLIEASENRKRI